MFETFFPDEYVASTYVIPFDQKNLTHTRYFSDELVRSKQSAYTEMCMQRWATKPIQYYLNCWKSLKTTKLQRTA